jgi:hypothetical protein
VKDLFPGDPNSRCIIGDYKPLGSTCQFFWQNVQGFPILKNLSKLVLNAQNSSSSLERFFATITGHTSKTRNKVHLETLEKLVQNANHDAFFGILKQIVE